MTTTRVSDLITIASRITGLTPDQINGPQRFRPIVRVRQAVAYVAAEQGKHTYSHIGRVMGGRDHTTIIHAHRMVPEFMKTDADLRLLVERLFIEAERHDPFELPHVPVVHYKAVLTMPPLRKRMDKPASIPRDDEWQGQVAARDMRIGSRKLLEALLAA